MVFQHSNFGGNSLTFPVSTEKPMIFHQNLRSYGLHDEASSVRLYSIPAHCSVFLFEHNNFGGRFIRITSGVSGTPVEVSSLVAATCTTGSSASRSSTMGSHQCVSLQTTPPAPRRVPSMASTSRGSVETECRRSILNFAADCGSTCAARLRRCGLTRIEADNLL